MSMRFAPTDFRKPISRVFFTDRDEADIHDADAADKHGETGNTTQRDFYHLFNVFKPSNTAFGYPITDKSYRSPRCLFTKDFLYRINHLVNICVFLKKRL